LESSAFSRFPEAFACGACAFRGFICVLVPIAVEHFLTETFRLPGSPNEEDCRKALNSFLEYAGNDKDIESVDPLFIAEYAYKPLFKGTDPEIVISDIRIILQSLNWAYQKQKLGKYLEIYGKKDLSPSAKQGGGFDAFHRLFVYKWIIRAHDSFLPKRRKKGRPRPILNPCMITVSYGLDSEGAEVEVSILN
jgi:hypothetical protein